MTTDQLIVLAVFCVTMTAMAIGNRDVLKAIISFASKWIDRNTDP
jgi:hypothetical protein